jgi:hypothetical protein
MIGCETIPGKAKAFHAKAQRSRGAKKTKQLFFAVFAPWRLCVRLFFHLRGDFLAQ